MMFRRTLLAILLVCTFGPRLAAAKDLCIQNDSNGDVLVLKVATVRPARTSPVGGYLTTFNAGAPNNVGVFLPVYGQSIFFSSGVFVAGLSMGAVEVRGSGTFFRTRFGDSTLNLECNAGSNAKLDVLDPCTYKEQDFGIFDSEFPAHVVPCLDSREIP